MKSHVLTIKEQQQVQQLARQYYEKYVKNQSFSTASRQFGLEIEYSITDHHYQLVPGSAILVTEQLPTYPIVPEYGSYQIEIHPPPLEFRPSNYNRLYEIIRGSRSMIENIANHQNLQLLSVGIPFKVDRSIVTDQESITPIPRYQISTEYFHRMNKIGSSLRFQNAQPISLPGNAGLSIINELHVHLQALDIPDLIELFNYSQMLTAPLVALGANSGITNGHQLIDKEYQIRIFEEAEGLYDGPIGMPRTGLFPGYIDSIDDFYNPVLSFTPLYKTTNESAEEAFELIIGKYFGWTRIRIGSEPSIHARIEFRPLSTQPTVKENLALAVFYLSALLLYKDEHRSLLPASYLQSNFEAAYHHGMSAILDWDLGQEIKSYPVTHILSEMMQQISKNMFTSMLESRIQAAKSPADKMIETTNKLGYASAVQDYQNTFKKEKIYL